MELLPFLLRRILQTTVIEKKKKGNIIRYQKMNEFKIHLQEEKKFVDNLV